MKGFFFGLFTGAALSFCIVWFGVVPGIRDAARASGFTAGNTAGLEAGTKDGIVKGLEQAREKVIADSARAADEIRRAAEAAAAQMRRKKPEPVQNWHVINGQIADPVSRKPEMEQ